MSASVSPFPASSAQPARSGPGVSSGVAPGPASGARSGLPAGVVIAGQWRRQFRCRWGAFLRAHFHSPVHVAAFFSVDEKTARMWWEEVTEPKGWVVAYACAALPAAAPALLRDAA